MSLSIIVAMANNNCIGNNNELLWKIPEDMKFFKETTTGHTIVMGKKTFLSIGRALPNRRNIILTRDKNYVVAGVEVFHSIDDIILLSKVTPEEVFIIGGGEIYKQFLPLADKLYITHVKADFSGDTFFPNIDIKVWKKASSRIVALSNTSPYPLEFATYERITPTS